ELVETDELQDLVLDGRLVPRPCNGIGLGACSDQPLEIFSRARPPHNAHWGQAHRPNLERMRSMTSLWETRTPSSVSSSVSTSLHCAGVSREAGSASNASISPAIMS